MNWLYNILTFVKKKPLIKHIIISFGVFILVLFIITIYLSFYTQHGGGIITPNLQSMSLTEVDLILKEKKLIYKVVDSSKYNSNFPKYSVVEQTPIAGKKVKEGRKIYLTINPSSYERISLPKIIQITLRNATSTLRVSGFSVGTVTYEDNIGKDMVLRMEYDGKEIFPGDMIPKTSKIDLVCGNGKKKF